MNDDIAKIVCKLWHTVQRPQVLGKLFSFMSSEAERLVQVRHRVRVEHSMRFCKRPQGRCLRYCMISSKISLGRFAKLG